MVIGKDTALRLLLATDQVDEAEAIVTHLRNSGIAVRPLRPESIDDLAAMLAQQPVDQVLAEYAATTMPFDQVARAVMGCGRDVPLLAVLDGISDDILESVQAAGAQAVALRSRPAQLLKNVLTEWHDLDARRSQRLLEAQMAETQRRCDMLIDSSRDPIAYVHEGMHIRANQAYLEMFGYEGFDDIEGMSLLDLVATRDVEAFKQLLRSLSRGDAPPPRYELSARDAEGNEFPAVMEFSAARYEGEACQQVVFRRQAAEADPELARQVEELRQRDAASGLLNRPTFLARLDAAVADTAARGTAHGLLLVEPDHYARLLEVIGLDATDQLVAALGQRLQEAAPNASIARFGEHQIAVLLPGSDHAATLASAEAMRAAVAADVLVVGDNSLNATVSSGGVQIGEKIASTSRVLSRAAQNLASAVGLGGNRIDLFDPSAVDRAELERIAAWVQRIEQALDNDGFQCEFQPIIALQGDGEQTYEMFLRLPGSDGVPADPADYLPIAEEHGLLGRIDRWTVRKATQLLAAAHAKGRFATLLVSVSHEAVLDPDMARYIGSQLGDAKLPGEFLMLAVTEAKVFVNLNDAQRLATALEEHGARLVLEDFGTGLNSLQILQHFTPGALKIDPQLIADLAKNNDSKQAVAAITREAQARGVRTIAPGVQDAASMTLLFSSAVDYVQGDFLAPAGPEMNHDFS